VKNDHQIFSPFCPKRLFAPGIFAVMASFILIVTTTAGCKRPVPTNFKGTNLLPNGSSTRGATGLGAGYIDRMLDYLEHLEIYESAQIRPQVLYQLNLWSAGQAEDPDWKADTLSEQLSERYAAVKGVDLSGTKFDAYDFFVLREAVWLRDIAQSAIKARRDELLRQSDVSEEPAWLATIREQYSGEVADDLRDARWLFDWTIRNIQIEATPEEDAVAATRPGAKLYAWESLLLGRGDYLNRARIFLLLARQHHIDVVMLKFVNDSMPQQSDVWLAGVLLHDEVFLFDTLLGLPIPDLTGTGVATLSLVREHPELLRSLDLGADEPYWMSEEHLDNIQARVDGTPASMSRRMQLLERSLSGEHQMTLFTSASKVAAKVRRQPGITDARLWTVPYDAFLYHHDLQSDAKAYQAHERQFETLAEQGSLYHGRLLQFRGEVDSIDEFPGAKKYYLSCRPSKQQIAATKNSPEFKQIAQAIESRFKPEATERLALAKAKVLASMIAIRTHIKQSASYWLGLVFSEQGEHSAAIDYFADRTLKASPAGPWTAGATYNLARSYEALGQFDEAIKLYNADVSPQRHGNRVRAKRLVESAAATITTAK